MIFKGSFNYWPLWHFVVIEKIWVDQKRALAYDIDNDEIVDINMTDKEDDPKLLYVNKYALVGNKRRMVKILKQIKEGSVDTPDGYHTPNDPFKWPFWYEFTLSMVNPKYGTLAYIVDDDRVVDKEILRGQSLKEITPHIWTRYNFTEKLVVTDTLSPIPSHIWDRIRSWTLGDSTPIIPEIIDVDDDEEPYSPQSSQFLKNGKVGLRLISPLSKENEIKIKIIKRDPRALLCVVKSKDTKQVSLFSIIPSIGPLYSLILDNKGRFENENKGNTSYYIPWKLIDIL